MPYSSLKNTVSKGTIPSPSLHQLITKRYKYLNFISLGVASSSGLVKNVPQALKNLIFQSSNNIFWSRGEVLYQQADAFTLRTTRVLSLSLSSQKMTEREWGLTAQCRYIAHNMKGILLAHEKEGWGLRVQQWKP